MRSISAKRNIIIAINRCILCRRTEKFLHLIDFSCDGTLFVDSGGRLRYIKAGWVWFAGYDLKAELLCSGSTNTLPDINNPRFRDELEHETKLITHDQLSRFINMNKHRWRYVTN